MSFSLIDVKLNKNSFYLGPKFTFKLFFIWSYEIILTFFLVEVKETNNTTTLIFITYIDIDQYYRAQNLNWFGLKYKTLLK